MPPRLTFYRVLVCASIFSQFLLAAEISGTIYVREGESRSPAGGVRVEARTADGKEVLRAVETDPSGRYTLANLPPVGIRVSAAKKGYVAPRTAGVDADFLLDLTTATSPVTRDFELLSEGVITGRVTDFATEPLKGVEIELQRTGGSDFPLKTVTDENGAYRVFGLEPGRYVVLARRDASPLYFPGTSVADQAQPIDVVSGTEREGIDLRFPPKNPGHAEPDATADDVETGAPPPSARHAEEAQGSISGYVVSAQTGELLRSASVHLSTSVDGKISTDTTSTGPGGVFSFDGLAPGDYSLSADKAGYEIKSVTPQIALAAKQSKTGIAIPLNRMPLISGRVRDWEGRPVTRASVTVYRLRWVSGRRVAAEARSSTTDDRGMYRVALAWPGRYIVGVSISKAADGSPKGELDLGSGRTFYPSATRVSQAVELDARYGQELTGINLDILPQETFSVSGVVADAEVGGPCTSCVIQAVSRDESYNFAQTQSGVAPNGAYMIRGLSPGSYRILVEKNSAGHHSASSRTIEITNQNEADINLLAGGDGSVITGRVVFESEPPPDPVGDPKTDPKNGMVIVLTTSEAISRFETARVGNDRTFQFSGLSSENYAVQINGLPRGGHLKAILVSGRELAAPEINMREEGPLGTVDLVVSFKSAQISGQVKIPGAAQEEPPPAKVVLVPRENQSRYLTNVRSTTKSGGSFEVSGVPPGSYTAFAVLRDSTLDWEDPVVCKQMETYGKAVELESGKAEVLELPLAPADLQ